MCSAYNDPTEEAVSSELEAVASARRKREVVGATEGSMLSNSGPTELTSQRRFRGGPRHSLRQLRPS